MKKLYITVILLSVVVMVFNSCSKVCPTCNGTGKITKTEKIPLSYSVTEFRVIPNFEKYAYTIFSSIKAKITIENKGDEDGIFIVFINVYYDKKITHTEKSQIVIRSHTSNTEIFEFFPNSLISKVKYRISPPLIEQENEEICPECEGDGKIPRRYNFLKFFGKSKDSKISAANTETLLALTKDYYNAMIIGNKETLLSYYDYPMKQYFSKKNASKKFVEQDVNYYFSKWSYRTATRTSCEVLEQELTKDTVRTQIVYKYNFTNNVGKIFTGKSTTTLTWLKKENVWKIVSTSEEVEK